ncbi:MAG: CRTAC1 family protein, partial [Pirellulales bacterium]
NADARTAAVGSVGGESDGPPPPDTGIRFSSVGRQRGLKFEWPQQPRPMRSPEAFGCGCALFDYDNDGWQDVLLVADPSPRLYRNLGQGHFIDVTSEAGIDTVEGDWTGCAIGDYDGDGFLDILVTGLHRLVLFQNIGGSAFREATTQAGLDPTNRGHWGSSAGFMDLDGDGHLDLVILNYVVFGPGEQQYCELAPGVLSGCPPSRYKPEFGEMWRNDGHGRLSLVHEAGLPDTNGKALVLAFADLDRDGRMDFYIGNDGTEAELMHNLGGMKFENLGFQSGLAVHNFAAMAAMAADWADFDRDGLEDLTVTGFADESYAVFRNFGNLNFDSASNRTGIAAATFKPLGFGAKWLDMDNDSWPDVAYANGHVYDNVADIDPSFVFRQPMMLFHNRRGERFADLVPVLRGDVARPLLGRGLAAGDIDNDGRIDLLVVDYEGPVVLLLNESRTENHWIKLDLRSAGSNRFAYGARLTGRRGDEVWIGQVSPASSYLSSSDPRIHWGLGKVDRLDSITIHWLSGHEEVLHDVAADRIVQVMEGEGIVRQWPE